MNFKIKQYLNQGLIYAFGSGMDAIVGFLVLPIYTSSFSTTEYGIFSLLMLVSTLSQSFFYLGASSSLNRSYFDYNSQDERKKVATTSLYLTIVGALFQIFFGIIFAKEFSQFFFNSNEYEIHFIIILCSSAFRFISQIFYLLLRLLMKASQMVFVSILSNLIFISSLMYLLNNYDLGILSPILSLFIANLISLFTLFLSTKKHFSLIPNFNEFMIQIKFGLPQILIGFFYYFIDWIDRYFINEFLNLSDVGIYSFGYKIGMLIHIGYIMPFSKIWVPIRSEQLNSKNLDRLNSKVFTYFYLFGSIFSFLIILFIDQLVFLFSSGSAEFSSSKFVIPFVLFGHLFFGMINILDIGIFKSRKPIFSALLLFLHIPINIILNILLLPKIGYIGAAISTLITYLSLSIFTLIISNRFLYIKYEYRNILIITFILFIFSYLSLSNPFSTGISLFDKLILLVLFISFYYYFFFEKLKKDLKNI